MLVLVGPQAVKEVKNFRLFGVTFGTSAYYNNVYTKTKARTSVLERLIVKPRLILCAFSSTCIYICTCSKKEAFVKTEFWRQIACTDRMTSLDSELTDSSSQELRPSG